MKIAIPQLAEIIENLEIDKEVNFSQEPDSNFWGIKRITAFEGEVILSICNPNKFD